MIAACEHDPLVTPVTLLTVEHPNCTVPSLMVRTGLGRHCSNPCAFVMFCGELDASTTTGIVHALQCVVGGHEDIVVDLSAVSFVDGAGWRMIVQLDELLVGAGRVWIHDPSRSVRRLMAILEPDRDRICVPPMRPTQLHESNEVRLDDLDAALTNSPQRVRLRSSFQSSPRSSVQSSPRSSPRSSQRSLWCPYRQTAESTMFGRLWDVFT